MEDKQKICDLLLLTLQETSYFSDLINIKYNDKEKIVIVTFVNNSVKKVNVNLDSGLSMIKDIIKAIE